MYSAGVGMFLVRLTSTGDGRGRGAVARVSFCICLVLLCSAGVGTIMCRHQDHLNITRPRQRGRLYTGTVGARGYGGVVGHLATWQGN